MRALVLLLALAAAVAGCQLIVDDGPLPPSSDAGDGAGDGAVAALGDADAAPADAHQLACDPYDGACGCYLDNDPAGGPACGAVGATAECAPCNFSRECGPSMFCTGFAGVMGTCRALCGGPGDVPCSTPGTCVSTYFDGWDWWGYCPGGC